LLNNPCFFFPPSPASPSCSMLLSYPALGADWSWAASASCRSGFTGAFLRASASAEPLFENVSPWSEGLSVRDGVSEGLENVPLTCCEFVPVFQRGGE
jgi:hypothetical protein